MHHFDRLRFYLLKLYIIRSWPPLSPPWELYRNKIDPNLVYLVVHFQHLVLSCQSVVACYYVIKKKVEEGTNPYIHSTLYTTVILSVLACHTCNQPDGIQCWRLQWLIDMINSGPKRKQCKTIERENIIIKLVMWACASIHRSSFNLFVQMMVVNKATRIIRISMPRDNICSNPSMVYAIIYIQACGLIVWFGLYLSTKSYK